MEQTFNDLYTEQQTKWRLVSCLSWMFLETSAGILRVNILVFGQGNMMKKICTNHNSAAIISIILAMPLGLTYVSLMFNIEPVARVLNNLFSVDGQQGGLEINVLGRIVIFGGLLLLPVALALNLQPMLKREGPEGIRKLYTMNLVVGAIILLMIILTWGGLILEEIYCLRDIRCD